MYSNKSCILDTRVILVVYENVIYDDISVYLKILVEQRKRFK